MPIQRELSFFVIIFFFTHNTIQLPKYNKTKQQTHTQHLNVQSKGRERGKDNKNTKVTPPYNHVYQTKNIAKHERELSDEGGGGAKTGQKNSLLLLNYDVFWNLDNIISGPQRTVQNKKRQFMTPLNKVILLFSKDALNWSKVTVKKTLIMLQNILIKDVLTKNIKQLNGFPIWWW